MVQVAIGIDFLFKDWQAGSGELWAVLRPHIKKSDFQSYVQTLNKPDTGHNYFVLQNMLMSDSDGPNAMVGVNLPSDMNIRLRANPEASWVPRFNDRRNGAWVQDPAAVKEKNVAGGGGGLPPRNRRSDGSIQDDKYEDLSKCSFAQNYNDALMAQVQRASAEQLPVVIAQVDHALTGGVLRDASTGFDKLDKLDILYPTAEDLNNSRTPLHSLLGLTFRLGSFGDANLDTITALTVELVGLTGQVYAAMPLPAQVQNLFAGLSSFVPPTGLVKADFDRDLPNRVYVKEAGTGFAHQRVESEDVFSLRNFRGDDQTPLHLLSELKRLAIRLGTKTDEDPDLKKDADDIRKTGDLNWMPYLSLHGQLRHYRKAGLGKNANGKSVSVLQFVPSDRDAPYMQNLLSTLDSNSMAAALGNGRFMDVSGKETKWMKKGDDAPDAIGAYRLLWDSPFKNADELRSAPQPDAVVFSLLFFGVVPQSAAGGVIDGGRPVVLLIPLPGAEFSTPGKVVANGTPQELSTDPLGPRWEVERSTLGAVFARPLVFDTLLLAKPVISAGILDRFAVAAVFADRFEFEAANSASRLELVMHADYPAAATMVGSGTVDITQEFSDDLINHNALNVFRGWVSPPGTHQVWLNPKAELYPVFAIESPAAGQPRRHVFHARFEDDTVKLQEAQHSADDIRKWLVGVYGRNGIDRTVSVNLEHTFGTILDMAALGITNPPFIPTRMDWPLQSAAAVGFRKTVDGKDNFLKFMTVDFTGDGDPNTPERVIFRFDPSFLNMSMGDVKDVEGRRQLCATAWRSIAEMAFAKSIKLQIDARRFDFTAALKSRNGHAFAAGLRPANDLHYPVTSTLDVTAQLQAYAKARLYGNAPADNIGPINIGGTARLDRSANVLSFWLEIIRQPQQVLDSPPIKPTDLVATTRVTDLTKDKPFDANGRRVEAAAANALEPFQEWIKDLHLTNHPIGPQAEGFPKAITQAIGGKDGPIWHRPKGDVVPNAEQVAPVLVPFGYRPVGHKLGAATDTILRKSLDLIKYVVDCQPPAWSASDQGVAKWRLVFEGLANAGVQSAYYKLIRKIAELIWPIPAPWANTQRPSQVEKLLMVFAPTGAPGDDREALVDEMTFRLITDPSQYNSVKALLYTWLSTASGKPNPDFFSLEYRRQPNIAPTAVRTGAVPNDTGVRIFRDGVAGLADSWGGVFENLESRTYGNRFSTAPPALYTFEDFIEGLQEPETKSDIKKKYRRDPNRRNLLPAKPMVIPEPNAKGEIALASRKPTSDPVFLGQKVWGAGQDCPLLDLKYGQCFNGDDLRSGQITPIACGSPNAAKIVAALEDRPPPMKGLDVALFGTLFGIFGDELVNEVAWEEQFENDTFVCDVRDATPPDGEVWPKEVPFFTDLLKAKTFDTLSAADVLSADILNSLVDSAVPGKAEDARNGERIELAVTGGRTVLRIVNRRAAGSDRILRAYVLRQGMAFFLLLLAEAPIWRPFELCLIHERNSIWQDKDPTRPLFAPDFLMASNSIRARAPLQAVYPANALVQRSYALDGKSAAELIRDIFEQPGHFGYGSQWRSCDLSITVSRWLRRKTVFATPDQLGGQEGWLPDTLASQKLPVHSKRFSSDALAGTTSEPFSYSTHFDVTNWAEDGAKGHSYVVEFQWYQPQSNVPVARLAVCLDLV